MSFITIKDGVLNLNSETQNLEAYLLKGELLVLFFGDDMFVLRPENEKELTLVSGILEVRSKNETVLVERLDVLPEDKLEEMGIILEEE